MKNKFCTIFTALVLSILFTMSLFCFLPVNAQNTDFINAPSEADVLSLINQKLSSGMKHPYIHGDMSKLLEIKDNLASGEKYTVILYDKVKKTALSLLDEEVFSHNGSVSQQHSNVENRVLNLMICYFIEDDVRFLNRALAEFEALKQVEDWASSSQLDNTQTAAALAICYDWLYDYLTDSDKTWAENTIKEKSVDIAYEYYKDPSKLSELRKENNDMNIWCWRGTYNHITYNNSNLLVSSLAIAPRFPEYASFVISKNLYNIQPYLELVGSDAGHEEPVGYFGYTTGKIINMLSAVNSSLGTMFGYENYPGFKTTAYYPFYMYGAGPFSFGDCTPKKATFSSNYLYFTAKHSQNTGLMSLISETFSAGDCAKVLLWYEKGELCKSKKEQLPYDKKLSTTTKLQNVASFRNSWNNDYALYAAIYAGNANANGHSDAVSGTFAIHYANEIFVTPQGIGDYDYPGYWDSTQHTSQRWKYYEKRPEANNCLVINPSEHLGQDVNETAIINEFETNSGGGYAVCDLSGVYKDYVTSYKRGLKIFDNRSRVIIQDEVVMKEKSDVFLSFTTPAQIEIKDDNTAIFTKNGKQMLVRINADCKFKLFVMNAEKLATSPVTDMQRTYPNYRKLAISAENVEKVNITAEFIPLDTIYDYPNQHTTFEKIADWSASGIYEKKPYLENIYVNGEELEIKEGVYVYEKHLPSLLAVPHITWDNPNGYNVSVEFPSGREEAVIHLSDNTREAWYVVKFKCAMLPTDDASVGGKINSTENNGRAPYVKFGSQYYSDSDSFCAYHVLDENRPGHLAYFKFNLSKLCNFNTHRIKSAKLVLTHAPDIKVDGLGGTGFWKVSDNWSEDTINYVNAPLKTHELGLSSENKQLPDIVFPRKLNIQPELTAYEYDITELVNSYNLSNYNTIVSFAAIMGYKYNYFSNLMTKECEDESMHPRLIIELENYNAYDVGEFELKKDEDNAHTISVSVTNNKAENENNLVLYLAAYFDGVMRNIGTSQPFTLESGESKEISAEINIQPGYSVKAFLWDMNGIYPLGYNEY